jgi:hypothetical protein
MTVSIRTLHLIPYSRPRIHRAGTYRVGHDLAGVLSIKTGRHA